MADDEWTEEELDAMHDWLEARYTPEMERLLVEHIGQPANDDFFNKNTRWKTLREYQEFLGYRLEFHLMEGRLCTRKVRLDD